MENPNKRSLMVLSIVEIVMSVIFFILGMVDGFKIRFGYVSLLYTQCWLAALALPIGVMALVLACSRRPSLLLINAIWSASVACILYSAMIIYLYHFWGMEWLLLRKQGAFSDYVKKDIVYTEEERDALAVFGITIILSIIEIMIAAAIAKTSDASYNRPQPSPMYYMHYQPVQNDSQLDRANAGAPAIHGATADNQPGSGGNFAVYL